MKEVLKLIKEEKQAIENLMVENQQTSSTKELILLHNKKAKLFEIENKVNEYQEIK